MCSFSSLFRIIYRKRVYMEKELSITYYFRPGDFNEIGRRKDGVSFRDLVKDFERDFHEAHTSEYALNLYANSTTMAILAKSCDAAPFMIYGMELTQSNSFDPEKDPYINHEMDKNSQFVYVYCIDSAFMTDFDENGYPILTEDSEIYPLTLLVDKTMSDGTIKLSTPTLDDDETENIMVNVPKYEFA